MIIPSETKVEDLSSFSVLGNYAPKNIPQLQWFNQKIIYQHLAVAILILV